MLFLGIISWKDASCFNWGRGRWFSDGGGFIFKWGVASHEVGISFDGGGGGVVVG